MVRGFRPACAAALAVMLLCGTAQAATPVVPASIDSPDPDGAPASWRAMLSTYAWLAGFSGQVRPVRQAPTVSFDKSFGDVWDHLDASLFVNAMARRGRWVLLGDLNYTSSSDQGQIHAVPGLAARGGFDQTTALALGGYRLFEDAAQSLDLHGGARLWRVNSRVAADLGGQPVLSLSDRFQWIDPVVALRYRRAFGPRDEVMLYADAGGFGVGAKRSWQWSAIYNRQFADRWTLSAGYRALSTDYRGDGHLHDVRIAGPLLGIGYRF